MATFYENFKFAVESCGCPAPTPELFTTPMAALGALGTAIGSLEFIGTTAKNHPVNFIDVLKAVPWMATVLRASPTGTQILPYIAPGAEPVIQTISMIRNTPKGMLVGRVIVYAGGCVAAAYFGVLVGATIYAATPEVWKRDYALACEDFWHWWYNGTARDRETAEMQKILMQKREAQQAKLLHERAKKIALSGSGMFQPNLA